MKYIDFLKIHKKCPFCCIEDGLVIKKSDLVYLIIAKAPYTIDHLLVIPRRHIVSFLELNSPERQEIDLMIKSAIRALNNLGHQNYSILLRQGSSTGQSLEHLHYHIIPDIRIGLPESISDSRLVMDFGQELVGVQKIKIALSR